MKICLPLASSMSLDLQASTSEPTEKSVPPLLKSSRMTSIPRAEILSERTPSPAKNSMKIAGLTRTGSEGVEGGGAFGTAGLPLIPAAPAPPHLEMEAFFFLPRPLAFGTGCMNESADPAGRCGQAEIA